MKTSKSIHLLLPSHLVATLDLTSESEIEAYVSDDCVVLNVIEDEDGHDHPSTDCEEHTVIIKAITCIAYKECECE